MRNQPWKWAAALGALAAVVLAASALVSLGAPVSGASDTAQLEASFDAMMKKMEAARPGLMKAQAQLLAERYDLSDRPAKGVTMSRGKAIQEGPRTKLPPGMTWEQLAAMAPADIKGKNVYPNGFLPLPHPNHPEGGMIFPHFQIEEVRKQTGRELTRFDLDFDIPDLMLPEFPPAIYLTTHPELGDVSQGKLVTLDNYWVMFSTILNTKQLEGLRLLVSPFPQAQFNATDDRRAARPSMGVTCFDCHANGHANGASHLAGDARPQAFRHRIETPSLRGVNIQQIFGSQRAMKSVEDFTEFEQRAAYFDGDPVQAQKKGVNILERGSQVHFMAEFQNILDFPPAPKLGIDGKLDPALASPSEMRGQMVFFGKGQCASCHQPPYYTDNTMHDLKTERFYTARTIAGDAMVGDGPIKTFPLRGLKDSPPYLHDGRLMTIEDTIEFFNLVDGTKLTAEEKKDLAAFLRAL